jgi:hypothetical protein
MHQLKIPETLLQKRIASLFPCNELFYFQSTKNIRFQDKWNFKLFRELYVVRSGRKLWIFSKLNKKIWSVTHVFIIKWNVCFGIRLAISTRHLTKKNCNNVCFLLTILINKFMNDWMRHWLYSPYSWIL